MDIEVRLFASAREVAGTETMKIALAEPARLEDLQGVLFERHPDLKALRLRFAINARYASGETELRAGDEVAAIPPVGGG